MTAAAAANAAPGPTVRSVLERLSAECVAIGAGLSDLQYLTGTIVGAAAADKDTTVALQELDRLTQTAEAAARALAMLASSVPMEPLDERALRDAIGLPSVADRVLGGPAAEAQSALHGKTDFF